jgi:integrase
VHEVAGEPLAHAKLLRKPNVRRSVVDEAMFAELLANTDPHFQPVMLFAYDTGMRKREVLDLKWSLVDLKAGVVRLAPQDTKGGESRTVYLTSRVRAALAELPRALHDGYVFMNPSTWTAWADVRTLFLRACRRAGIEGLWFHDLRRSFVTNARRRGIAESVVMKMSGHRTRAVFDRYNIVSEADLAEAIVRLEAGQTVVRQDSVKVQNERYKSEKPSQLCAEKASVSS